MASLQRLVVHNYRALRRVDYEARNINVLFGPNGVGKTTFLDALWFLRDCAIRGTEEAASTRHHGIGALTDSVDPSDEQILIGLETETAIYQVSFGFSAGRIEPFVGERLTSRLRDLVLIQRQIGSAKATFFHDGLRQQTPVNLLDPDKLAYSNYLLFTEPKEEALELDALLRSTHRYDSRAVNFHALRRFGSDTSVHTYPLDRWQNLWSALRNLDGLRGRDDRFDRIMGFMRRAFPDSFKGLTFEQLGADRVGCSFDEKGRQGPIQASGVSDGHLQLLGLLTSLLGDRVDRSSLLLFDEPEASLHPHAIAVFAEAVRDVTESRHRQVFIATHSPVLISQFTVDDVVVVERGDDASSTFRRVSEIGELRDLLEQYALGSLYMAEQVGEQGRPREEAVPGEAP